MRAAWGVILLIGACTPAPGPTKPPRPHPEFPISEGEIHALGRMADDGPIACASCHPSTVSTFSQFECTGCHEHSEESIAPIHASVIGYSHVSLSCGVCHAVSLRFRGFAIAQPPAASAATIQGGIAELSHPAVKAACTSCHTGPEGGRRAFGYDHSLAPATGCAACHEAGSDMVGSPWVLNAADAVPIAAQCGQGSGMIADRGGDTRPVGIASLACSSNAANIMCGTQSCSLNHFYPRDCSECHLKPADGRVTVETGAGYATAWAFPHFFGPPAQPATCCQCHGAPLCSQ